MKKNKETKLNNLKTPCVPLYERGKENKEWIPDPSCVETLEDRQVRDDNSDNTNLANKANNLTKLTKLIKLTKLVQANKGSALVLTMVVMVIGLFIVSSISAVSILESKMSQKTRHSTPALQKADSGLELVFGYINNSANGNTTIEDVCGGIESSGITTNWNNGCCKVYLDSDDEEEIKVYFIKDDGSGYKITDDEDLKILDEADKVKAIRSVGIEKINDTDYVTRTLQSDLYTEPAE